MQGIEQEDIWHSSQFYDALVWLVSLYASSLVQHLLWTEVEGTATILKELKA